jgi:hypothetical protein
VLNVRKRKLIAQLRELIRIIRGEILMWHEFPIPTDPKKQREIIRQLRKWIESLESRGIVKGFAFDHYSPNPEALHIRFDCADKENLKTVRKELENEVKKLLPNYVLPPEDRLWDGGKNTEQVYRAYEFGSRCAFLAWKLIESGRFPEEYFSNFSIGDNNKENVVKRIPFEFQTHLNHGIMNSLGISEYPNEALIHLKILKGSTRFKNSQGLIDWMEKPVRGQ